MNEMLSQEEMQGQVGRKRKNKETENCTFVLHFRRSYDSLCYSTTSPFGVGHHLYLEVLLHDTDSNCSLIRKQALARHLPTIARSPAAIEMSVS